MRLYIILKSTNQKEFFISKVGCLLASLQVHYINRRCFVKIINETPDLPLKRKL